MRNGIHICYLSSWERAKSLNLSRSSLLFVCLSNFILDSAISFLIDLVGCSFSLNKLDVNTICESLMGTALLQLGQQTFSSGEVVQIWCTEWELGRDDQRFGTQSIWNTWLHLSDTISPVFILRQRSQVEFLSRLMTWRGWELKTWTRQRAGWGRLSGIQERSAGTWCYKSSWWAIFISHSRRYDRDSNFITTSIRDTNCTADLVVFLTLYNIYYLSIEVKCIHCRRVERFSNVTHGRADRSMIL